MSRMDTKQIARLLEVLEAIVFAIPDPTTEFGFYTSPEKNEAYRLLHVLRDELEKTNA